MNMDLRILFLSLILHLAVFYALEKISNPINVPSLVEIEYQDSTHSKAMNTVQNPQENQETSDEKASFLSTQRSRFKKQTISPNLGVPHNQSPQREIAQKKEDSPSEGEGSTLLPLPSRMISQEVSRQSSVPFEVPHLAKGNFTFLNSDFSMYASFYSRITPKIVYTWGQNVSEISLFPHMVEKLSKKSKWVTRVELTLDEEGHFFDVTLLKTSGSDELDAAVIESLRSSTPFLNPPTGMIDSDKKVRIQGEFTVYTQRPRWAR